MSIFSGPKTVVRQRSSRVAFALAGLVVFAVVASAVFAWKYRQLPPPSPVVPRQATAIVVIHDPTFSPQRAWQEILVHSKLEVRDRLGFSPERRGDTIRVSVSLTDSEMAQDTLPPLVNVVASAFVETCRAQSKVEAERAFAEAQERLRETQRLAEDANSRLEALRQRQNDAIAAGRKADAPSVVMVENPQWAEAARRLAELEERRRVLLLERTPQHPAVVEIQMRIDDMRREMGPIPAKIAQFNSSPTVPQAGRLPVAAPAPAELEAAAQAADTMRRQVQQAVAAAQRAQAARNSDLRVDLHPAEALPAISKTRPSIAALLATALAAGTTSVVGLGMISFGATLAPTVSSIGQLQALLPVPILGVVPATESRAGSARSPLARRLARYGAVLLGLFTLAAVAWVLAGGCP